MMKILEIRALPPLMEKRNDLLDQLEVLTNRASKENRSLNAEEVNEFNKLKNEIRDIDEQLEKEKRSLSNNKSVRPGELRVYNEGESLGYDSRGADADDLNLGQVVRALSGADTSGDAVKYVRSMTSSTGAVVIPQKLAGQIIDKARAQSCMFGKIPTIGMDNNNLKVAKIVTDGQASFVAEGQLIPESSIEFGSADLNGKTIAIFVPISEQLLDSANIADVLMTSCSKALATALDEALIYGDGEGANIKGITTYANINKPTWTGDLNYNALLTAIGSNKSANINATDVCYSTTTSTGLAMLQDTLGQYITPPKALDSYNLCESNNIKDTDVIAYDRQSLLLGINRNITIELGYTNDNFQRMVKSLRIYMRCDLGVIQEKGVSLVKATV